jgi:hypothetical protein
VRATITVNANRLDAIYRFYAEATLQTESFLSMNRIQFWKFVKACSLHLPPEAIRKYLDEDSLTVIKRQLKNTMNQAFYKVTTRHLTPKKNTISGRRASVAELEPTLKPYQFAEVLVRIACFRYPNVPSFPERFEALLQKDLHTAKQLHLRNSFFMTEMRHPRVMKLLKKWRVKLHSAFLWYANEGFDELSTQLMTWRQTTKMLLVDCKLKSKTQRKSKSSKDLSNTAVPVSLEDMRTMFNNAKLRRSTKVQPAKRVKKNGKMADGKSELSQQPQQQQQQQQHKRTNSLGYPEFSNFIVTVCALRYPDPSIMLHVRLSQFLVDDLRPALDREDDKAAMTKLL